MQLKHCQKLPGLVVLMLSQLAMAQGRNYVIQREEPDRPYELRLVRPDQPALGDAPADRDRMLWVYADNGAAAELPVGIHVSPVPPAMSAQLRLGPKTGVVVENVVPGSAAEQAGIQRYDMIERVDNRPVSSPQQLHQLLSGRRSGDDVKLSIIREGDHRTIHITIKSISPPRRVDKPFTFSPQTYLRDGFKFSPEDTRQLDQLTEKLRQEVQRQEQQIERLKENLRREADHAKQELQQLKDQIREEVQQQKQQMLEQLKDKRNQDRDKNEDNERQENRR